MRPDLLSEGDTGLVQKHGEAMQTSEYSREEFKRRPADFIEPGPNLQIPASTPLNESSETSASPDAQTAALEPPAPDAQRPQSSSPAHQLRKQNGKALAQHRKLSKEELETMAERLSRVEKKEKKEPRAHPMQLKYEFNSKSRKYTERYIRAKKVSSDAQTEYLKALAERCVARQQQTEAALRQKYLKPLNPNAKKLTKADMEEHMAKVQRLFQGQGVVDKP